MHSIPIMMSLAALLIAGLSGPSTAEEPTGPRSALHMRVPRTWSGGQLLVKLRPGAPVKDARALHAARGTRVLSRIRGLGVDVVALPSGADVLRAARSYRASPLVEAAEPNLRRAVLEVIPPDGSFADGSLWGLKNTGAPHGVSTPPPDMLAGTPGADGRVTLAWDQTQGSPETVIAIVDSGVDVTHPDLAPNLWVNQPEAAGLPGVDDDANGYVDDIHGCDFTPPGPSCTTLLDAKQVVGSAHGTHVAGIAAAVSNPGAAPNVVGVCPKCRIMVLKIGDQDGISLDAELRALAYAKAMGADVVNASYGGSFWSKLERDAIAALAPDAVMVAAAGNCALDNDQLSGTECGVSPLFPASYDLPNLISVAASNHGDRYGAVTTCEAAGLTVCTFTHIGRDSVDLAAPGSDILSTLPAAECPIAPCYGIWDGTSMAAPFVAGVAALVDTQFPQYSAEDVRNSVLNAADHPEALGSWALFGVPKRGVFTSTGNGRVNAQAALLGNLAALPASDGTISGARSWKGGVARGSVGWPADANDVFARRLKKGTYRVLLNGPGTQWLAGKKEPRNLDLFVWRPGVTEVWQFEPGCVAVGAPCRMLGASAGPYANELIKKLKVKKSGMHYFVVNAFYSPSARYELSIERVR